MTQFSLLRGPLPLVLEIASLACLALTIVRGSERWWTRTFPILVVGSTVVVSTLYIGLRTTRTVVDDYPPSFLVWVGLAIFAGLAAPIGLRSFPSWRRVCQVLCFPMAVASAFLLINAHYAYWPTLGSLVGAGTPGRVSAESIERILETPKPSSPPGPQSIGVVGPFDAPARVSGLRHRVGSVYLPPAFLAGRRESLPIIMMIGGTPGSPQDWIQAGYAIQTANEYAQGHKGVAPILVFVDPNGSAIRDTECVDGPRGSAETYLTVDVRNAVVSQLHITRDSSRWAIAGFSEGGECAYLLSLRHPDLFRGFVDLAGDWAPHVGGFKDTLINLFGGSKRQMKRHDPWILIRTHRYDHMCGWFGSGTDDVYHARLSDVETKYAALAGVTSHQILVKGTGHDWSFGAQAFHSILPSLISCLSDTSTKSP